VVLPHFVIQSVSKRVLCELTSLHIETLHSVTKDNCIIPLGLLCISLSISVTSTKQQKIFGHVANFVCEEHGAVKGREFLDKLSDC